MRVDLAASWIGAVLLAGPAQAQGATWTVDDDGPADFVSIAAAVASPAVLDGDVVQVHGGSYGSVVLDKSLSIVAEGGGWFSARSCWVENVETFTLSGMRELEYLVVRNVTGRGSIDACEVGRWVSDYCYPDPGTIVGSASFADCADLVVTRSKFNGTFGCYPIHSGNIALEVSSSTVAIVDGRLTGGYDDKYTYGFSALSVDGESDVTISGSTLSCGTWYGDDFSVGAIVAHPGSVVRIRGSSDDVLTGNLGSPVSAHVGSAVTVSGVSLSPNHLRPWVTWVRPDEPYLRVRGSDELGGTKLVELYGPPGRSGLVLSSLVPAHIVLASDLDPLWLDPTSLLTVVPLTTIDQEIPRSYRVSLPADASLVGTVMVLQTWFPPVSGQAPPTSKIGQVMSPGGSLSLDAGSMQKGFLTNPANIVVRW